MGDVVTAAMAVIIILGQVVSAVDRRRLRQTNQLSEPIVIELSITVDPTLQRQPSVTAYAKQNPTRST